MKNGAVPSRRSNRRVVRVRTKDQPRSETTGDRQGLAARDCMDRHPRRINRAIPGMQYFELPMYMYISHTTRLLFDNSLSILSKLHKVVDGGRGKPHRLGTETLVILPHFCLVAACRPSDLLKSQPNTIQRSLHTLLAVQKGPILWQGTV